MRFLISVHYFMPHIGGMEEVAKKQAESLVAMGHEVQVVTCRPRADTPLEEKVDGYRIKRFRALNFIENKFGVTFPIISPFAFFSLLRQVRHSDVVHIHDVFYISCHLTALAAMVLGKPVFVTQHVAMVDHPSKLVMLVQKLVYGTFGRMIFSYAKKIVCYNTNVRSFLLNRGVTESKIILNYNGIDIDKFSPVKTADKQRLRKGYNLPLDRPIALFVGRLVPKKGYDIVYQARSSRYLTLIVGSGERPVAMREDANVKFWGPASQEELQDLYRLSDVFVFPAIGEVFTLVMQEAMACGLPVLTTNDPAYAAADINDQKLGLVARDTKAIAAYLNTVIDDNARLRDMGDYSRALARERFSWQKNYAQEASIYNEVHP